ncbi:motility associated factor glycosyltransferase family protein [Campylobacter upsaliensis]|uniref:motility associated factor glycosyltransferase family protein n=1 Tax=Campylobacter upsaliensis TaxID=28080 RepID=UPI002B3B01B1|nr:motility associated factor glycosyltransferase family protein [Campylobacter upsaliensis]MEB2790908.1 motility associated factor glycosyltransferase family protein [Campylobacter upsaliensis]
MNTLEKNLNALENQTLKLELRDIKHTHIKPVFGKDSLELNFSNLEGGGVMYQNPLVELKQSLEFYNEQFAFYPVLYFYGFGNGLLFKALLQSPHHKHLVIFERNLELLWLCLSLIDFSKELKEQKLIIYHQTNNEILRELCTKEPFLAYAKTCILHLGAKYYENFQQDYERLALDLQETFSQAMFSKGNNLEDALQGVGHFIHNLPAILNSPSIKELLNKRQNIAKTAIIVSTGPSLMKQLPLLKEYREKALIFCADSAYPILAKHNIKPDFVCMVERSDFTAEFFKHDFGDFDEGICFILKSVVHPNALKYMEQYKRNYIVFNETLPFIKAFRLDAFALHYGGPSVANLAFVLSLCLKVQNIILIGQDLSYDESGFSHPKDYQHGQNYESESKKFSVLAYGREGFVETNLYWNMFKHSFEADILEAKKWLDIDIFNATEGGVKIEGTIEKSFKQCCEELLKEELKRPFGNLNSLNQTKQDELLLKCYAKIYQSLSLSEAFLQELEENEGEIQKAYETFSLSNPQIFKETQQNLVQLIENCKEKIEKNKKDKAILFDVLNPLLAQFEFDLATILVQNAKNIQENYQKTLLYANAHLSLISLAKQGLTEQKETIIKHLSPLENALNHLSFYKNKIKEKYARNTL